METKMATEMKGKTMEYEMTENKNKHPFYITCRICGSKSVEIYAFDYGSLEIRCKSCGKCISCGRYDTEEGDYSWGY